jgi:hypothetical protein
MTVTVLMHGSVNWAISKSDKWKIGFAEMKFVKATTGHTCKY